MGARAITPSAYRARKVQSSIPACIRGRSPVIEHTRSRRVVNRPADNLQPTRVCIPEHPSTQVGAVQNTGPGERGRRQKLRPPVKENPAHYRPERPPPVPGSGGFRSASGENTPPVPCKLRRTWSKPRFSAIEVLIRFPFHAAARPIFTGSSASARPMFTPLARSVPVGCAGKFAGPPAKSAEVVEL